MSQVNMAQALNSPSYAEKVWINYYYQGNSMGVTDAQMGEIAGTYKSLIPDWKHYAESQDFNEYELTDESFDNAVDKGYKAGQDMTGYKNSGWDKTKQIGNTVVDGSGAVVSGAHAAIQGGMAAGSAIGKVTGKGAAKATGKACDWILLAACALDLAQAVKYKVAKPNEKQIEAVRELANDAGNQQATTMEAQDNLITMDSELAEASDSAIEVQDDANTQIGDSRTLYQFHADTIEYFEKAKVAGHEFTQDEVEAYQESIEYMTLMKEDVGTTQEESEATVNEIYDEMGEYQDGFDDAAENIANVQGITDYAAGFDELTQSNCSAEGLIQTVNMGSAGVDTALAATKVVQYAGMGWAGIPFALAFAAAGVAAGAGTAMDGVAAAEQKQWAGEAENEVGLRETTQEMNEESQQTYEENIDYYDGYMQNVEDLEIIVPDDMEIPEAEIPSVGSQNPSGSNTGGERNTGSTGATGGTRSTGNNEEEDKAGKPKKPKG